MYAWCYTHINMLPAGSGRRVYAYIYMAPTPRGLIDYRPSLSRYYFVALGGSGEYDSRIFRFATKHTDTHSNPKSNPNPYPNANLYSSLFPNPHPIPNCSSNPTPKPPPFKPKSTQVTIRTWRNTLNHTSS